MKNTPKLLLFAVLILLLQACKKDSFSELSDSPVEFTNTGQNNESHVFNFGGNFATERNNISNTVLGDIRVNPYTVANMTTAYNNLNDPDIAVIATTNLYVKFCPQTIEEVAELFEMDLNLYDYPLEYEVIEMGDSYEDPTLGPDDFPCFYSIEEPGFELPSYGEIVDEIHISKYNTRLTEEAFKLTGNDYEKTMCFDDDPNWPECQCDDFIGTPMWQDCIDNIYEPPPPPIPTDCLNSDPNKPSGFVRVQNTQTGMEGVRQVKIILKDTWFTEDEVWTNDDGCFQLKKEYKNNVWMWIKWKNDRCKIRGVSNTQSWKIWKHLRAHKDFIDKFTNPPYNDIEVNYYWDANLVPHGSKSHIRWAASTVNNAVHQFHDYAITDGIDTPPSKLNIYLGRNSTEAFALMTKKVSPPLAALAITNGLNISGQLPQSNFVLFDWAVILPATWSVTSIVLSFFPDIHIGLADELTSDQLQNVAFHEIAHASHFSQVGIDFWLDEITATVAADGWGDPNSFDAGRIAICESWAQHVGDTYTDREYGLAHSNVPPGSPPILIASRRFINDLEGFRLFANHVPVGVYHDLVDDNSNSIPGAAENPLITNDDITGFTMSDIFQHLENDVTTPQQIREEIKTALPAGVTATDIDDLFGDYGY